MAKEVVVATLVAVAVVVVAAAVTGADGTSAGDDGCDAGELTPCLPSIAFGSKPSGKCCSSLRGQQGCFCRYAHDPRYGRFVSSPHARHALDSCGIAIPNCG